MPLSPPPQELPILQKVTEVYLLWHAHIHHLPRSSRFTLGSRIDQLFLETIEHILTAGYAPHEQKLNILRQASTTLDTLKFFLKIAWQTKTLPSKQYAQLSPPVAEVGRMLGGWRKQFSSS